MNDALTDPKNSRLSRWLNPKIVIPLVLVLFILMAPFFYRSYQLSKIPDPGSPFDVDAFIKQQSVDAADNAISLFRSAMTLKVPIPTETDWQEIYQELLTAQELSPQTEKILELLKQNEPALLKWKQGTEKPHYSEIETGTANYNFLMPVTQEARDFARYMVAMAALKARQGDYKQAVDWLIVSFQTSRLVEDEDLLISRLVSVAIFALTCDTTIKIIQDIKMPVEVLEEMQRELEAIHATLSPVSDSMKAEFLMSLNSYDFLLEEVTGASGRSGRTVTLSLGKWGMYFLGEPELYKRAMRQWMGNVLPQLDKLRYQRSLYPSGSRLLLYNQTGKPTTNKRQLTPAQIDQTADVSFMFQLVVPGYSHFMDAIDSQEIRYQLLTAALHLEIYRRKHQKYPDSLKEAFSDAPLPVDVFEATGSPLMYVKDSDQECRIWSVGMNGFDDGGTNLGFDRHTHSDFGYHLGKQPEPEPVEAKQIDEGS